MKANILTILLVLGIYSGIYGQNNIVNTLGTGGTFIIQDNVDNLLTVSQTTGYLTLKTGTIFKGNDRFIHNYNAPGKDGRNTFIGINSGNFTMGAGAGTHIASGNTGTGYATLNKITTGWGNSAFGEYALENNTIGEHNSAFGRYALQSNTAGVHNSAFGVNALYSNLQHNNSAFGSNALYANTTGSFNSAFGTSSLVGNTIGNSNSAFGYFAMKGNTTGNYNSAFGHWVLNFNTTGSDNCAFGNFTLQLNQAGNRNTAFGNGALNNSMNSDNNTAFGHHALAQSQSGHNNVAVGISALNSPTGNHNTAIGSWAGYTNNTNLTGSNLTLIGANAQPSSFGVSNEITLGDGNITTIRANVQSITSLSDERDKKNIQPLNLGIDFIMKVQPRVFNWDKREWYEGQESDGSKIQKQPTAGFIAQEFDALQTSENAEWLNLVLKSNPDKYEATAGNLLPIMVKAIQDLKKENDELKIKNSSINSANAELKTTTARLSEKLDDIEKIQVQLIAEIEKLKTDSKSAVHVSMEKK